MSGHFEVVRTDADPQPWHGRLVIYGRSTWVTENMTRQVGVERAICSALREMAGGGWGLRWNGESRTEKVAVSDTGFVHDLTVRYVDERGGAS
jgi:hypothetical protein